MGGNGSTSITVERSSTQVRTLDIQTNWMINICPFIKKAESHLFAVSEIPSKEVDCVLIFDEETGVMPTHHFPLEIILNDCITRHLLWKSWKRIWY